MKQSDIINSSIFIFATFIFLISFFTGESINDNLFRWTSGASSAVVVVWYIYEKWIWRWFIFRTISDFSDVPNLRGTWKGEISFVKDVKGNKGNAEIYTSIDQTLTTISVRSFFKRPSESYSVIAKINKLPPNQRQLIFCYKSEAPFSKRKDNPPHDGTCILNITGKYPYKLSGSYFTEREGAGIVKLTKRNPCITETFEDAEQLRYKKEYKFK